MKNAYTVEFLDIEHIELKPIHDANQYPDMARHLASMQALRLDIHHGKIEAEQKRFDNIGLIMSTYNRFFAKG